MRTFIFCFIVLFLQGCTSFHGSWITSTYGLTSKTKQQYGYIKSAHELYPVLNVEDNIYVKFDLPNIQKNDAENFSCNNNYKTITLWIWSEKDLFLNTSKTVFINKNKKINIKRIKEWKNGNFTDLDRSLEIKIKGSSSVDDKLVKQWKSNRIDDLLKSEGLNVFKFNLSYPISCNDNFELNLAYQLSPNNDETIVSVIYFTFAEYQRFNK